MRKAQVVTALLEQISAIDAPSLDCAYKLQEYAGQPKRKLSEGKQTWPGRKQIWRAYRTDGTMKGDVLSLETDRQGGEALIVPVMKGGKRVGEKPTFEAMRARAARDLARLPAPLRQLEPGHDYPVSIAEPLKALAAEADRATVKAR